MPTYLKTPGWLLLVALLPACAGLGMGPRGDREPLALWRDAHAALDSASFAPAIQSFDRLAREHPDTEPGRESLFYLGALHLDPRNPAWDSQQAEESLRRYLAMDPQVHAIQRRPEARTLYELAQQLNLPPDERSLSALQPGTRTRVERVVVPGSAARAQAGTIERLRTDNAALERKVKEQGDQLTQLQAELDRIRRTLTGTGRRQ